MPKKLMKCVKEVSKEKGKKAAWPICVSSTGQKPHKKGHAGAKGKKECMMKESVDQTHLQNFINSICNKDFASANQNLKLAIREKTKMYIEEIGKEIM
jgi:hypothetical protein